MIEKQTDQRTHQKVSAFFSAEDHTVRSTEKYDLFPPFFLFRSIYQDVRK